MSIPAEPREPLLAALREVDPAGFRSEVRAVLAAQASTSAAARALGVAEATLRRWISEDPAIARGISLDD